MIGLLKEVCIGGLPASLPFPTLMCDGPGSEANFFCLKEKKQRFEPQQTR